MEKIGFIGLGEMGSPMAKNLVKSGYTLFVFDIRKETADELVKSGAKACSSAYEVGQSADITFVMARTTEQVENIVLGDKGLLQSCKAGSCIIISATVNPLAIQKIAGEAKKKKVEVVDAPVSGAKQGAEAATLSIMAGGDEATFKKIRPVLDKVGKNIFYLGSYGMGEVAKIANNLLLLINMNAAYEAVKLAQNAGLSLDALLQIAKPSSGGSWVLEHWDMVTSWKENYKPEGTMDLIYKDFQLAYNLAKDLKTPLLLGSLASQLGRY
jgi:3-hydroxyisobutyrate dehydrogenase-like beta-hydroxyacid dehydrogenase